MGVVNRTFQPGDVIVLRMAAEKIEAGEMVNRNSAGYASAAADASGETFEGVAEETVDNSDGSAGDKLIRVRRRDLFKADVSGGYLAQDAAGAKCYVYDSETVAVDSADVSNNVQCGTIAKIEGSTVWVDPVISGDSYTRPTTTT